MVGGTSGQQLKDLSKAVGGRLVVEDKAQELGSVSGSAGRGTLFGPAKVGEYDGGPPGVLAAGTPDHEAPGAESKGGCRQGPARGG